MALLTSVGLVTICWGLSLWRVADSSDAPATGVKMRLWACLGRVARKCWKRRRARDTSSFARCARACANSEVQTLSCSWQASNQVWAVQPMVAGSGTAVCTMGKRWCRVSRALRWAALWRAWDRRGHRGPTGVLRCMHLMVSPVDGCFECPEGRPQPQMAPGHRAGCVMGGVGWKGCGDLHIHIMQQVGTLLADGVDAMLPVTVCVGGGAVRACCF